MKNVLVTIASVILSIVSVKAQAPQTFLLDSMLVFEYNALDGMENRNFLGYVPKTYTITLSPTMDSMVTVNLNTGYILKEEIISVDERVGSTSYTIKRNDGKSKFEVLFIKNSKGVDYIVSQEIENEDGFNIVGWEQKQKRTD